MRCIKEARHMWIWCNTHAMPRMLSVFAHPPSLSAIANHPGNAEHFRVSGTRHDDPLRSDFDRKKQQHDSRLEIPVSDEAIAGRVDICLCHPTLTMAVAVPRPSQALPTGPQLPPPCPVCSQCAMNQCACDVHELVCIHGHRWFRCPAHGTIRILKDDKARIDMHTKRGSESILNRLRQLTVQHPSEEEEEEEEEEQEEQKQANREKEEMRRQQTGKREAIEQPCWCHPTWTEDGNVGNRQYALWHRREWTSYILAAYAFVLILFMYFHVDHRIQTIFLLTTAFCGLIYRAWVHGDPDALKWTRWRDVGMLYLDDAIVSLSSIFFPTNWTLSRDSRNTLLSFLIVLVAIIWITHVQLVTGASLEITYDSSKHCVDVLKGECKSHTSCVHAPVGMCSGGLVCCPLPAPPPPDLPLPSAGLPIYDATCSGNVKTRLGTLWLYVQPDEKVAVVVPEFRTSYFDCHKMREIIPIVPLRARNLSIAMLSDGHDGIHVDGKGGWVYGPRITGSVVHPPHQLLVPPPPYFMSVPSSLLETIWCGQTILLLGSIAVERGPGHVVPAMVGEQGLSCDDTLVDGHGEEDSLGSTSCHRANLDLRIAHYTVSGLPDDTHADTCPLSCYGTLEKNVDESRFSIRHEDDESNGLCLSAVQCIGTGGQMATVEVAASSCASHCDVSFCCLFGGQGAIGSGDPQPLSSPSPPAVIPPTPPPPPTETPRTPTAPLEIPPPPPPLSPATLTPTPIPSGEQPQAAPTDVSTPITIPIPTRQGPETSAVSHNNDSASKHRLGVVSGLDFLTLFLAFVCSTCVVGCFFAGYRSYHWRRYGFVHLGNSGSDDDQEGSMHNIQDMFEMGPGNNHSDANDTKAGGRRGRERGGRGKGEKDEAENEWVELAVSEEYKPNSMVTLSSKPTSPQISPSSSSSPYMLSTQTPAMDASIFDSSSTSADEAGPSSSLSEPPIQVKTLRRQKDMDGKQD